MPTDSPTTVIVIITVAPTIGILRRLIRRRTSTGLAHLTAKMQSVKFFLSSTPPICPVKPSTPPATTTMSQSGAQQKGPSMPR